MAVVTVVVVVRGSRGRVRGGVTVVVVVGWLDSHRGGGSEGGESVKYVSSSSSVVAIVMIVLGVIVTVIVTVIVLRLIHGSVASIVTIITVSSSSIGSSDDVGQRQRQMSHRSLEAVSACVSHLVGYTYEYGMVLCMHAGRSKWEREGATTLFCYVRADVSPNCD